MLVWQIWSAANEGFSARAKGKGGSLPLHILHMYSAVRIFICKHVIFFSVFSNFFFQVDFIFHVWTMETQLFKKRSRQSVAF